MSNSGPYSAQIQRAIAGLLAGNNTWTGTNTFTGAVIYSGGITTPSITFTGGQSLVGSTADVTVLSRSTNLQEFRLGPSGDCLSFQKGTGSGFIQTSSSDNLNLGVNNTQYWRLEGTTGHFGAVTDNVNDIGASGANRPRTLYAGTSVVSPAVLAGAGTLASAGEIRLPNAGVVAWRTSGNTGNVAMNLTGGTDLISFAAGTLYPNGYNFYTADSTGLSVNNAGVVTASSALNATETTYANRPATPAVGMLCNFSDSNTATWGATIAGGGAKKVCGRYNGTNWTVVGV